MSSLFLTPLRVEWLNTDDDAIPTWKLLDALVYHSESLGRDVIVPPGFVTDFASVPRLPVIYLLAGNIGNRAAVVHDYLIYSKEVPRKIADEVYKEALLASGVDAGKASLMYRAVQSYTTGLDDPWTPYSPQSQNA